MFEAAFGSGYSTPPSEMTWTDPTSRLWGYTETTGIQYQSGPLQATNATVTLDNYDNYLASQNSASPYYPDVLTGTPLRLRMALGTLGGNVSNRWHVIQRNAQEWQEAIDEAFRRYSPSTMTDIWSTLSSASLTPYRGEVYADNPYAWWPCDDLEGDANVPPTTLLNAATGNSNVLDITFNSVGLSLLYLTNGATIPGSVAANIATYKVNAAAGWMWGDPQVTPSSVGGAGKITASPGANAWQALGQLGNTGSQGYYLVSNDPSFPPLSGGVTVEGWFQYPYFGGQQYYNPGTPEIYCNGPYAPWTLLALTTNSNPVAILQIDTSGHLNLITYNGSTPTSHSIYTTTDLRDNCWRHYAVTLTPTTWQVFVNGGLRAFASGTATGMTSAWTYLVVNGDMGSTHGGGTPGSVQHGANVIVSHVAVYPELLPGWRLLSHYNAAITGFGLLPTPTGTTLNLGAGITIDGQYNITGNYADGSSSTYYYYPAQTISQAGSHHSGPSVYVLNTVLGNNGGAGNGSQMTPIADGTVSDEFAFYTYNSSFVPNIGLTQASVSAAPYDVYTGGFGGSTVSIGLAHISAGSGGALPSGPDSPRGHRAAADRTVLRVRGSHLPRQVHRPRPFAGAGGPRHRRAAVRDQHPEHRPVRRRHAVRRQPREPHLLAAHPPRLAVRQPRMADRADTPGDPVLQGSALDS